MVYLKPHKLRVWRDGKPPDLFAFRWTKARDDRASKLRSDPSVTRVEVWDEIDFCLRDYRPN